MATVTHLGAHRRRPDRVDVHLDGVYALTVPLERAADLYAGQELDDLDVGRLREEAQAAEALDRALRLIAVRPRSRAEVLTGLARSGVRAGTAEQVIGRLEAMDLVDDAAFARWWVEDRSAHRPRARRGLAFELAGRGVPAEVIRDALEGVDDEALAVQAARERAHRYASLDRAAFELSLGGWLGRRGFSPHVVRAAVAAAWKERGADDRPGQ